MHTFFASKRSKTGFFITGEELKHLRVRRIKRGEKIGVLWEEGLYLCELESCSDKEAVCKVIERLKCEKPPVSLTLFQAITVELKTFEDIIRKSTELGVSEVVPLITERSFRKTEIVAKKRERWEKIIREAMKQARRPFFLKLEEAKRIEEIEPLSDINLFLDSFSGDKTMSDISFRGIKSVSLVVGPEGGFSKREGYLLREKGFTAVKLCPYVMRSETASAVAVGIVMNLACP